MSASVSESALSKYRYEALFGVWLAVTGATFLRIRQYLQRHEPQRVADWDRDFAGKTDGETLYTCTELRRTQCCQHHLCLDVHSTGPKLHASQRDLSSKFTQNLGSDRVEVPMPACQDWNAWGRLWLV
ncbi:predicted protein [Plenodomus lingam JN3]|uniref:Uncharacterized protein n=1 Tax=Leptosphaeria maculans (strain JN3 / isolate v23.1.3 / race Av1-4-5-6-7-8) TaxID=985895 RepID=E5A6B4_LEPMJ|nr:predicted protein [Plenodomus lingam JN3]CBX99159.1 predicted protein [Plenodomus lingam JN3]